MDPDPGCDFADVEHIADLAKRQTVEVMKVDGLAVLERQGKDGAQQLTVFGAVDHLVDGIDRRRIPEQDPGFEGAAPVEIACEIRDRTVEPSTKVRLGRGRVGRGPYPSKRLLHQLFGGRPILYQHHGKVVRRPFQRPG